MKTWAKVGLVFIMLVVGAVAMQETRGKPEVSISCNAKGNAGTCVVKNNGSADGNVEVDVVLVCRDGEHISHLTTLVTAKNHVTKIIDGFSPEVGLFSNCAGIDYRNMTVRDTRN